MSSLPLNSQLDVQPYAGQVFAGRGELVSRLCLQVSRIAPHFRTALVTGEEGTGKNTVARALYEQSATASLRGPFQVFDLSTFASSPVPVRLSGVLFLTGLHQLDPTLQEPLVERLKTFQRHIRIIVSSRLELKALLATGRLRQSLASRICGLEIRLPSLQDRIEDCSPDFDELASAMLALSGFSASFSPDALAHLKLHSWKRNLLELHSVVAEVSKRRGVIDIAHLPELLPAEPVDHVGTRLDQVMQKHVFEVLQRCAGNKLKAAHLLGISRSTLYRMLEAAEGEPSLPNDSAAASEWSRHAIGTPEAAL